VIDPHIVRFERPTIYPDPQHYPDILVFDKDYQFKYALEGTDPSLQRRRGTLYPWKRNQIEDADFATATVQVTPTLGADDIVFGFYAYREQDVVFSALDCNPFTT